MTSSRKRKQRPEFRTDYSRSDAPDFTMQDDAEPAEQGHNLDSLLFVQAYEADIIRGPRASQAAASLEVFDYRTGTLPVRKIGDALIQWGEDQLGKPPAFPGDEDELIGRDNATQSQNDDNNTVWVDRYDARLLLDALPLHLRSTTNATRSVPDSPGGWSDIPSDSEDTFFFSPQEVEDFHREKKRRLLDTNREERLRARRIEDGESSEVEEDEEIWGGSDEEPDDSQRELMRRTAQHILSSPKPAQLEMRILANHGGDKKFAFLRGRWSRVWRILKGKARREKEEHDKERDKGREDKVGNGLGVLVGYEDSEDEGDDDDARNVGTSYDREAESGQSEKTEPANQKPLNDDITKMARRARAKEWAEKRRAL